MEGAAVEGANRPNKDSEVPLDFPESYISREKERESYNIERDESGVALGFTYAMHMFFFMNLKLCVLYIHTQGTTHTRAYLPHQIPDTAGSDCHHLTSHTRNLLVKCLQFFLVHTL